MTTLKDKVILITGATRGIGHEIALRCARDGAKIVVCGKTTEPHPTLPGTIYSVSEEIKEAGGEALPMPLDVRDENQIQHAVHQAVHHFGGIDILINNASAISLMPVLTTPIKKYDLLMGVNVRGTFACAQACLPHLQQASNPHILTMSPPLNLNPKWFGSYLAYTLSKYGMSMCTLGLAEEYKSQGIAANSLWPKTIIATAAIAVNSPVDLFHACRKPAIVADAAHWILTQPSREVTGNFFIDEEILRAQGVTDFSDYAVDPTRALFPDLYLD